MKFKNKFFNKNINLIVSVVALIECIFIIGLMTFSWIESASSLVITGEYLEITPGRNYEYVISSEKKLVDLSTYFINSEHFSFAPASSADGNNFYFPHADNTLDTVKYRKGDTTDFNVTYYNFDFEAANPNPDKAYSYYFESVDMFKLPDKIEYIGSDGKVDTVTSEQKDSFLEAFRVAVTVDNETTVYSKSGSDSIKAVNNISGAVGTQFTESFSDSLYPKNNEEKTPLFTIESAGRKRVNVKIWFEEKTVDLNDVNSVYYQMLGASVDISIKLISEESEFKNLTFNDYSLFTSDESSYDDMYYVYTGGGDQVYYPMVRVNSTRDCISWQSSDESDSPVDALPSGLDLSKGYFTYGHYDKGNFVPVCKWQLDSNVEHTTVYNAISATKTKTTTIGYGYWSSTTLSKITFIDRTTCAVDRSYNANANKFIKEDRIYAVRDGIQVKLNYFASSDTYEARIPSDWFNNGDDVDDTLPFVYTSTDYYDVSSVALKWLANEQSVSSIYTALGYSEDAHLSSLSNNATGVGTWDETEQINLSAELVDFDVIGNPNSYFRVGFAGNYIFMSSNSNNPFYYTAFVPVGSSLSFDYGTLNSTKISWNAGNVSNSNFTHYVTDLKSGTANGLWNLAVLVDGTTDNLIHDTLHNVNSTGASLTYTVGDQTKTMHQIDNYRWITEDISNATSIDFEWVAYTGTGYIDTRFTHTLNIESNGIHYLTFTEHGTIIEKQNAD